MRHLAILGSTRGTSMLALIDAIQQKKLDAKIEVVISNKSDAPILQRAQENGLPFFSVEAKNPDALISQILRAHKVDVVILIGYMRILSNEFVNEWRNKMINVHPSLLPAFAGGMDGKVHQAVLDAGVTETGCTVHYVTEEVDAGPILVQKKCAVLPGDTVESLKVRVQELEGVALIEAVPKIQNK